MPIYRFDPCTACTQQFQRNVVFFVPWFTIAPYKRWKNVAHKRIIDDGAYLVYLSEIAHKMLKLLAFVFESRIYANVLRYILCIGGHSAYIDAKEAVVVFYVKFLVWREKSVYSDTCTAKSFKEIPFEWIPIADCGIVFALFAQIISIVFIPSFVAHKFKHWLLFLVLLSQTRVSVWMRARCFRSPTQISTDEIK